MEHNFTVNDKELDVLCGALFNYYMKLMNLPLMGSPLGQESWRLYEHLNSFRVKRDIDLFAKNNPNLLPPRVEDIVASVPDSCPVCYPSCEDK